jgi:hypothetical protein
MGFLSGEAHKHRERNKIMITNPVFILGVIALILAIVSYYPGAPTLGVAVILLAIALLIGVAK